MKPTLLQYPDFNKEFCITTDASKQACGAVLTHDYNNTQLPVAYASRSFTKGELKPALSLLSTSSWDRKHFQIAFKKL